MKIAVLFGSFNPLTNAHLAIREPTRLPNGLEGKFAGFYREFGEYPHP